METSYNVYKRFDVNWHNKENLRLDISTLLYLQYEFRIGIETGMENKNGNV